MCASRGPGTGTAVPSLLPLPGPPRAALLRSGRREQRSSGRAKLEGTQGDPSPTRAGGPAENPPRRKRPRDHRLTAQLRGPKRPTTRGVTVGGAGPGGGLRGGQPIRGKFRAEKGGAGWGGVVPGISTLAVAGELADCARSVLFGASGSPRAETGFIWRLPRP